MIKRALSILLSLTMLLSLVVVPASAESTLEGNQKIELRIEAQQGEWKYNGSYKGSDPNTYYTVAIFADSELESFAMGKGELYLSFDKNVVAFAKLIESEAEAFEKVYNAEEEDYEKSNLALTSSTKEDANEKGFVTLAFADMNGKTHTIPKGTLLATLRFTVKENAESCSTTFGFRVEGKNTILGADTVKHTVDDSATATVTINGVAPTLGKVTVTDKDNNTVLDTSDSSKTFGRLEVNGTRDYTYQAHAWSTSGKEITGNVTWKLKSGSNLYDELNGATISKEGLLTIPRDAGAELSGNFFSFWVVATPRDGVSGNAIETNNIQINHEAQEIKTIQISRKEGETGALIIPGTGEAAATAEFVATCTNQYDKPYTGNQTIYWNYGRQDTNKSVTGIRMNGAVLSVSSDAKSVENGSVVLVVTATAGSGEKKVTSNGVEITVQRDAVQRPARIEVTGTVSTLAVPKTGEQAATATYTATVYDQYGTEIENPGEIRWYLEAGDESQRFNGDKNFNYLVTKETAQTFAEGSTSREITIKAICGDASGTKTLTLTRQPAEVTRIVIEGIHSEALCKVPTMDDNENFEHALTVKKIDQYGVTTEAAANEVTWDKLSVLGVTLQNGTLTIQPAAAGNDFTTDKYGNLVYSFDIKATCGGKDATKTITLKRQPSVATAITYNDTVITVVPTDDAQVPTKAAPAVEDQYGLLMNNATVESDGALPTGIVLENGELYITKAAVKHFNNRRQDEVQVSVSLKCAPAENTAKLKLKLAAAQINKDSAEISGQASIAKPTGEQTNTAVYSILNNKMKDQYGLPLTFEPSNLTMKLYSDAACERDVKDGPVTLSGNTITVTKDAELNKAYYLMASYQVGTYSHMQCAPVVKITITDKAVSETPLPVVQGDITCGETVSPSVSNTPAGAGDITYTYVGRDGTTYNSSDAPTNAGKYTVTATCEDANYIYTGSVDFQILPKKIKVDWIELDGTRYTYNGQQQTVKYTVKDGNTTLVEGRDYTAAGDSGTNAGPYLLEITGKGNYYSDPDATVPTSVTWNIWALPVKIDTATFKPRGYAKDDYSAALDTLTLVADKDGVVMPDSLTEGNGFTVSDIRVANNNAGQQPVSFKVTLNNTNYKWAVAETGNTFDVDERAGFKVEITKANHAAETVLTGGKYGNQLSVDLSQVLPEGWSATASSIDNTNAVLTEIHGGAMYIMEQDGKLWLQLTNDSNKVGKDATVTLTVNSTNYNPFTITVTVTAQKKETQTITASDLNVTYGDAGVKLNASALDNAKLTYRVTEGAAVIAVDANGNVTLLKSGTAKIQITAVETEDYGTANTTVTVTVAKRSLTVKANDLTAYVGGQLPALDYTVTGLVSGETLTTVPELELKDVPVGVDPMKTAGTYTIGFKTAPVADPDKYDLTVETGTLTVSSRPNVNPVPAGNSVKLEEAAGGKLTSSVSRATKGTTVTITVKPDAGYQLEELEVLDKNGEALPLKELANGKFSFQMPDSKVTVQASFVQESTYAGYPDVLPQDWFYSSVRYVTERGLMNGTPNGFEPNMDSSRATIWTILARFSGVDTTVVSGEWYAVARQWAMENGVSDGTNPNGVITREQLATMLYRFAKNKGLVQEPVTADLSVFVDAGQISDYALDAMRWAVSVGLLNGMDGSRLAPQGSAARAQVAAMLMRFDQLAK